MERFLHAISFALVSALTFLITACGGGGGGGSTPNNFSAKAIQIETVDPKIGYPLMVSMEMSADNDASEVTVSLFAIDKTDDPDTEVRQIPLGTVSIPEVTAGEASYELNVAIPSSVGLPGEYFVAAIIDPVDEFDETQEDDNTASTEMTIDTGSANVLITELNLDRLALLLNTDNYADQVTGSIQVQDYISDIENIYNADAGATITVGVDGLAADESIEVEAFANLRLIRTDNGAEYNLPLYLWNSDEARYMNAYGINPSDLSTTAVEWLPLGEFHPQLVETEGEDVTLNDVERNATQLSFYTPGGFGKVIEYLMRYVAPCTGSCTLTVPTFPTTPPPDLTSGVINDLVIFLSGLPFTTAGDETAAMAVMDFAICVAVRPADPAIIDTETADNEICESISAVLPSLDTSETPTPDLAGYDSLFDTPTSPLSSGDGYDSKGGGSAFSFGPLDYGASSSADYHGYIEEVYGTIPMTVFGGVFNFVDVSVTTQLVPEYDGRPADDETGFTIELRFLNAMIDSLDPGPVSFDSGPAGWQATMSYSVEAPEPAKEKQFFVGPVPMVASASVAGNIGVQYEFVFDEAKFFDNKPYLAIGNSISPFANVEATLSAGVGSALFSAGVEGVLTLLDERLEYFTGTRIDLIEDGYSYTADGNNDKVTEFVIYQEDILSNIFTGPQGAINLFAKYTVPKLVTCSWGFIKGKCIKAKSVKATTNIWRSPALFRFDDILDQNKNVILDVVLIDGKDPQYFTSP